jgi:hypothetical protein
VSDSFYLSHGYDFLAFFHVRDVVVDTRPDKVINVNKLVVAAETSNLLHFVDVPHKQTGDGADLNNVLAIFHAFDNLQLRLVYFFDE